MWRGRLAVDPGFYLDFESRYLAEVVIRWSSKQPKNPSDFGRTSRFHCWTIGSFKGASRGFVRE
jgi:hypothetical protein